MTKFEQLSELIKSRRSIFPASYTEEKIDDSVIISILENANWAPTHRKTEPWRFKIFSGESLVKLSDYLTDYYKAHTPKEKFSEMKLKKTKNKPLKSSHVIALCMQRDPEKRLPEWEEIAAVSCAVQNMWLSCTALGIGAYWSSPSSITHADEFLNLDEGERCLGIFYMGIPDPQFDPKSIRKPINEKIEWIR